MRSRSLLGVFLDGLGQFWAKQRTSERFNTLTKRMQTEEKNEGKEKTERMTTKRLGKPLGTGRKKKAAWHRSAWLANACRQTGTISACVCDRRDVETRRSVQRRSSTGRGILRRDVTLAGGSCCTSFRQGRDLARGIGAERGRSDASSSRFGSVGSWDYFRTRSKVPEGAKNIPSEHLS